MKDWVGNGNSIYKTLGASNHTEKEREANDYYATEPKAAELLLEVEEFSPFVWECACGEGHLAEVFKAHGYHVVASDIVDRGYGQGNIDFFKCDKALAPNIVTNPHFIL